jgi:general secretion pathway protein H
MRTSAHSACNHVPCGRSRHESGFSLIEMLVVIAIVAIATASVGLSFHNRDDEPLAHDAQRLSLLFAQAQTEARTGGRAITWRTDAYGYRFSRKPVWNPDDAPATGRTEKPQSDDFSKDESLRPRHWEATNVQVRIEPAQANVFMPEWIVPAMRIELSDDFQHIAIVRDGAGRYALQP